MPGKDSKEERTFKGLDRATPNPHLRLDYTLTGMRAGSCTSDWKWDWKKSEEECNRLLDIIETHSTQLWDRVDPPLLELSKIGVSQPSVIAQ